MNAENDDDTVEAMMKQMVDWATEMIGYFDPPFEEEGEIWIYSDRKE